MRVMLAAIAVFILAFPVVAQTIKVRSGDHPTFTRLALDIPPGVKWELSTRKRAATLSLKLEGAFLDTSNVFSRIQKTRLQNIQGKGPVLELALACDCIVKATLMQAQMLVIDILDVPETSSSEVIISEPVLQTVSDAAIVGVAPDGPRFGYGELLWKLPVRLENPAAEIVEDSKKDLRGTAVKSTHPAHVVNGVRLNHASQVQTELVQNIAKAATKGLLDPGSGQEGRAAAVNSARINASSKVSASGAAPLKEQGHIRIRTSLESPLFNEAGEEITPEGFSCPNPELVAIHQWGDKRKFGDQIGQRRANLTMEFDQLDNEVVIGLARNYLFFGFGAESQAVLALNEHQSAETKVLGTIAEIMDIGYGSAGNALLPFSGCNNDFAFWSILAHETLPKTTTPNVDAMLRTLNQIPFHLREQLGPVLSGRLLQHGNSEAAASVLRAVNRASQNATAGANMALANMALEKGELSDAKTILENVVEGNSSLSPLALVKLIDARLERNDPISAPTATLAAAFAQEYRDTKLGPELRRAHVLAQSRSNQFQTAFDALDRLRKRDGNVSSQKLRSQVLALLTENASDMTFLRFAFPQSKIDSFKIDEKIANTIAKRFLDLGFPHMATPLISDDFHDTASRERRLLRAQAALALGYPLRAEAEVAGMQGADADQIVAEARDMIKDHRAASRIFTRLGLEADTIRTAWLSGDWTRVAALDDPVFAQVADLVMHRSVEAITDDEIENEGVLATNRTLLEQSAASRVVLGTLLDTLVLSH